MHSASGFDAGGVIDIGWIRSPRFRMQGELDWLRATLDEFVAADDKNYHGHFYDLSGSVSGVLLGGGTRSRLVPYVEAGVGVHALSSSFGTLTLDERYNANPFGAHVGAGMRVWLSSTGRQGASLDIRRVIAQNVNRTSVRIGALFLFGDLVRPR